LMDSYKALPIGAALPDPHAFFAIAPTFLLQVFRGALTLALPLTVAMLAINLAFGVLARAAPALNPIQLGLPVALLLGLFLLTVLAGEMGPPVQRLFDAAFDAADSVSR
jgi:flagellar biosynthetic protein FliR